MAGNQQALPACVSIRVLILAVVLRTCCQMSVVQQSCAHCFSCSPAPTLSRSLFPTVSPGRSLRLLGGGLFWMTSQNRWHWVQLCCCLSVSACEAIMLHPHADVLVPGLDLPSNACPVVLSFIILTTQTKTRPLAIVFSSFDSVCWLQISLRVIFCRLLLLPLPLILLGLPPRRLQLC